MAFLLGVCVGVVAAVVFGIWLVWPWRLLFGLLEPRARSGGDDHYRSGQAEGGLRTRG
ncbi:hypothetical protein LCGC14_3072880 [marine sediment metagenome]|uniref:Uncharacterized protein n=1 Tax=marine sediment metagenome TaxID=412755 RepID=A0A0F8X3Z7_9ZZZZ